MLRWRRQDPENAALLWSKLAETNESIAKAFVSLKNVSLVSRHKLAGYSIVVLDTRFLYIVL